MSASHARARRPGHDDRDFSVVVESLGEGEGDLPVSEIVQEFEGRGFGAILLVVSLINLLPLPPGGTTLTGLPLLLLSLELALGGGLWLPRKVMSSKVSRSAFRKGASRVLPALRAAERLSAHRMEWLIEGLGARLIGVCGVVLSTVLILPIPLGNLFPALAMTLFANGLMERDGLFAIFGWLAAAISFVLLALVGNAVWDGANALIQRLF